MLRAQLELGLAECIGSPIGVVGLALEPDEIFARLVGHYKELARISNQGPNSWNIWARVGEAGPTIAISSLDVWLRANDGDVT
jgi:hypothetical protein